MALLAVSLALAAWLTVHWGLLPRIEQWKPWIEQRASVALGQGVRIGSIRARSDRWVPSLELGDVRLLDAQGRTALHLGRLQAALAPASLLTLQPRLAQLHVDGVHLDVRRGQDGRIRVAGLEAQGPAAGADDDRAAQWLFAQEEVVIRHGTVRWTDELRGAPPLALTDVDLVLRNGLRRHQLRLDASPPADWGERFTVIGAFAQPLLQRGGHWRSWSGTLHAQLPAADVGQLRRHVTLPFDLDEGRGALRVWLDLEEGRLRGGTADVALADVGIRLAPHLQPLGLQALAGRISARVHEQGVALSTKGLGLRTREGLEWTAGDLALEWRQRHPLGDPAQRGPVTGGRLQADRLDLAVIGSLAARLPLGRAVESTLQTLQPGGVLSGLDLRWTGAPDAPAGYQARGRVSRLVLAPLPAPQPEAIGRPGIAGADIDFELSDAGGKARLAMQQGALHFPGVFEDPAIAMAELAAQLDWRVRRHAGLPPAVELRIAGARFANDDVRGELRGVWHTGKRPGFGPGARLPGEIELDGRIERARADRVAAYLPTGIPVAVRRYVGRAVRGGQLADGSFAVKGDVWEFPFVGDRPGTFRLAGRLSDAQFDYLPSVPPGGDEEPWASPWPGFTQVSGDLLFDRDSMTLDRMQARLWGVQLRDVRARIDRLSAAEPLLVVQGEGRGPLPDLLRFVEVSPVGQWLGGRLATISASGVGDLRLALGIPLVHPDRSTVDGSVLVGGNDIRIRPDLPMLSGARGRIDFSHEGFRIVGGRARALGGELAFEGGSRPDGSLRFQAEGTATAEGLRRARELPPLPQVARLLRGEVAWRAQLNVVDGRPEVVVSSDLVGLHSDWPAPLAKAAETALPLRWQTTPLPSTGRAGEVPRDRLRADLGSLVQLRLEREGDPASPDAEPRIVAGSVGLNAPAAPTQRGVLAVGGRLPLLDAEAWSALLGATAPGDDVLPGLPRLQASLVVDELRVAGRRITQADLALHQPAGGEGSWQLQVTADQLAGRVQWRPPGQAPDAGTLTARLTRLSLPPAQPAPGSAPAPGPAPAPGASGDAARRWPSLDVAVESFEMRGRALGRLGLLATSQPGQGPVPDWQLERLELAMPGAVFSGSGRWTASRSAGAPGRMALKFGLELQDSGRLAGVFGWEEAVRGGKGRIDGELGWQGSPLEPDWASMEGRLGVALAQGQFLRAEPGGVGRLLGILSLQSLPRRLLLDFRDVFQQGFAFDEVTGEVRVSRGRAQTDNLRMRGLQASVFIEGSADLISETQELHVLIVPELNVGTASLAYLAVNPAVGLGTFLAQLLLRDPLRAASTREFLVSGAMAEPKVVRVERALPAPSAPSATPAASAPPVLSLPPPPPSPPPAGRPPPPASPVPERPA